METVGLTKTKVANVFLLISEGIVVVFVLAFGGVRNLVNVRRLLVLTWWVEWLCTDAQRLSRNNIFFKPIIASLLQGCSLLENGIKPFLQSSLLFRLELLNFLMLSLVACSVRLLAFGCIFNAVEPLLLYGLVVHGWLVGRKLVVPGLTFAFSFSAFSIFLICIAFTKVSLVLEPFFALLAVIWILGLVWRSIPLLVGSLLELLGPFVLLSVNLLLGQSLQLYSAALKFGG